MDQNLAVYITQYRNKTANEILIYISMTTRKFLTRVKDHILIKINWATVLSRLFQTNDVDILFNTERFIMILILTVSAMLESLEFLTQEGQLSLKTRNHILMKEL